MDENMGEKEATLKIKRRTPVTWRTVGAWGQYLTSAQQSLPPVKMKYEIIFLRGSFSCYCHILIYF